MNRFLFSLLGLSLATCPPAHAVIAFFGGYGDGVVNLATGNNSSGPSLRIVYDDFTFASAGDINGFDMYGRDYTGSPVAMYYEIRSGVSAGNGGTLLFSGTTVSASAVYLPEGGIFGTPAAGTGAAGGQYMQYSGGPATPIHLEAGTYWIGLAPHQGFGSLDLVSTSGLGAAGSPINNGNAFYSSTLSGQNFVSMGNLDFGMRISTVLPVPETGIGALIGIGALGAVSVRSRQRR